MEEKICVIIPARGRAEKIERCIRSILEVRYPKTEIIIVDDGLGGDPLRLLDNFKDRIKIFKSGLKGPSYARNLAAKNTDAPLLAFTDSDCIVDREWLTELTKGLQEYPDAVSCGGAQKIPDDASAFEKRVYLFMKNVGFVTDYMRGSGGEEVIEVNHNASCNVMYKREAFLKENGFMEGLWPGEDVEFDYRLRKKGYRIVFNPKAIVYHYRPDDIKKFSDMMYRYGKVQALLVKKYGFFRKIHLVPLSFFLLLSLLVLACLRIEFFGIAVLVPAILIALAFDFIRFLFITLFSWNWGFLRGLFSNK